MAETITMPKLGFDMAEGTLVHWVKGEGEAVNKGEILAEIETDKATVTVESSYGGVVLKHLVNEGDIVPVGTPIAVVGAEGEEVSAPAPAAQPEKTAEAAPVPEKNVKEAAPQAAQAESVVKTMPAQEEAVLDQKLEGPEDQSLLKASPIAKRIAREKGLDLRQIEGTGPGGRIVRRDVESASAVQAKPPAVEKMPAKTAAPQPQGVPLPPSAWESQEAPQDKAVPLTRLRAAIGRRMVESKTQVPHFYITYEYDFEALMKLRKEVNALLPEDQKISVNDFIVKATALALRQFPNINSTVTETELIQHGQVNIGIAVAVEGGLLTVVTKDADRKPLRLISQEIREMVARTRQGKVSPSDIEGSTFSISNLGMYNVDDFIAIINPPETAILAVGAVQQIPVIKDGEIRPGMRGKLTISADHRATDGAEAARFMQALAQYIENPMTLLL